MDEARYLQVKKDIFIKQLKDDIDHCKRVNEGNERDIASFTQYTKDQIERLQTYNMTPGEREQEKEILEYRLEKDRIQRTEDIQKNNKLIDFMEKKLQELQ
ncbi:TPA: hypothetical protein DEP21_06505 [Patescibacteria group bacterium]|nr:hypothetical protein [Candidatus Gracilibacteria bacterium]